LITTLLLVRHGHVEGIRPPRFRGRTDLPLMPEGVAEAAAVARRIALHWKPTAIYTSPLKRCMDTGAPIAQACGLDVSIIPALIDIDYGHWNWKTYDEAKAEDANLFEQWFATPELVRFPDGESLQDLVGRAADVLRFVREQHPEDTVVLVTHDSVNRATLLLLLDQPLSAYWRLEQSPCAINEISIDGGRIRVERINDTCHLAGLLR
jgi:probable phosphoglycerate mutase